MSIGVFKALANGIHTRGEGGVVYVVEDKCCYCFPNEFPHATFRGTLEDMLTDDDFAEMYIVVREHDNHLSVLTYPRAHIWETLAKHVADSGPAPETAPSSDEDENKKIETL